MHATRTVCYLALAGSSALLAACGTVQGISATDDLNAVEPAAGVVAKPAAKVTPAPAKAAPKATTATTTFTNAERAAAATTVATTNSNCTALMPFYWEIGDKTGKLASGTGGGRTAAVPTAATLMAIASASKWIFSTYVVEKQQGVLSTYDIQHLNMTSGYTNFNSCEPTSTVASCLSEPGAAGGTNGDYIASHLGKFFYNGGHMQNLGDYVGLGPDNGRMLGAPVQAVLGANVPIAYNQPQLAGGVNLTPAGYAQFLRNMLGGKYPHMLQLLGADAVCTETNSSSCPTSLFSPINQTVPGGPNNLGNLAWHYSLGHWVEDDPTVGDGAFSSLGRGGFYPWIDKTKTYYGVVAPNDPQALAGSTAATHGVPMNCGHLIREAWITPDEPVSLAAVKRK